MPLAEIQPLIEARVRQLGDAGGPRGRQEFHRPAAAPARPRIVLVNRPDSPQSVISGGQITPADPRSNIEALIAANDVLGGNFLGRLNMDLREAKGWSYGVRGSAQLNEKAVPYIINAPVQADRTGDSIKALNAQIGGFLGTKGVTEEELTRTIANRVNALPGQFETSGAVLSAMMSNDLLRPADQLSGIAGRQISQLHPGQPRPGGPRDDRSQGLRLGRGRRRRQGEAAARQAGDAGRGDRGAVSLGGGGRRRGHVSRRPGSAGNQSVGLDEFHQPVESAPFPCGDEKAGDARCGVQPAWPDPFEDFLGVGERQIDGRPWWR